MKVQVSPARPQPVFGIGDARERVHDGVQVRRDEQAQMLEVVAGVAHAISASGGRIRYRPSASLAPPMPPDSATTRTPVLTRSSSGSRTSAAAGSGSSHASPCTSTAALVGLAHQELRRRGNLVGEADL